MKTAPTRNLPFLIPAVACLLPLLAMNFVMAQNANSPLPVAVSSASTVDTQQESLSPLAVLEDCADAVAKGDFNRYADHLTADEQNIQAGFVVSLISFVQQAQVLAGEEQDPELILVTRAMDDLLRKHATSDEAFEKTRINAAEFQQAILGQIMLASVMNSSDGSSAMAPGFPGMPGGDVRASSLESAKLLKSPRDFLVDSLSEITQPMIVTRNGKSESRATVEVAEMLEAYKSAEWDLFTRGRYAVAVGSMPDAQTDEDDAQAADSHAGQSSAADKKVVVEFLQIDGQWKISRLLPTNMLKEAVTFSAVTQPSAYYPATSPPQPVTPSPATASPAYAPSPVVSPVPGIPYAPR